MAVIRDPDNVFCNVHDIYHINKTIQGTVNACAYAMIKFTSSGVTKRAKSCACVDVCGQKYVKKYYLALEMSAPCEYGMTKDSGHMFTCLDKRGIMVLRKEMTFCITTGTHEKLTVHCDGGVQPESICCMQTKAKLDKWPDMNIGSLFMGVKGMILDLGTCKWMGLVNGQECVAGDMKSWYLHGSDGTLYDLNVFECRKGHGIVLSVEDIEMVSLNTGDIAINPSGFINLKSTFQIMEINPSDGLSVGCRIKMKYNKNNVETETTELYGDVLWMGSICTERCVFVELDYPCKDGISGFNSGNVSFTCKEKHGAVLHIKDVEFDILPYLPSFIFGDDFELKLRSRSYDSDGLSGDKFVENWDFTILKSKNIQKDSKIFIRIEKCNRKFIREGQLVWFGTCDALTVAIVELSDVSRLQSNPEITRLIPQDLKKTPGLLLPVNPDYIFKYLPFNEKSEEERISINIGDITNIGTVVWKGLNTLNELCYGIEQDELTSEAGIEEAYDDKLFSCKSGHGCIVPASTIITKNKIGVRSATQGVAFPSNTKKSEITNKISVTSTTMVKVDDCLTLLATIAKKHGISSDELVSASMEVEDKTIFGALVNTMKSTISTYKHPEVVKQLLKLQSFDALQMSLDKCLPSEDNNKQLLEVAAESLKCGHEDLFAKCMNKCTNKDTLMDDGETFVTRIIKERISQSLIVRAIESYEFDITKMNKDNCIPLTLACSNMMMEVVECIVKYIKNQEARKKVCAICMDRQIGTVFNCGHTSCKDCSENISCCHICKKEIATRGPLFID